MGMADYFRRFDAPPIAAVAHNDVPNQDEVDAALLLAASVVRAVDDRETIIRELEIDPTFAMPAANWESAANDYVEAYRLLASLEWKKIRFLRLRCPFFTGTSLFTMKSSVGHRSTEPIPPNFETTWDDDTRDKIVSRWRALTKNRKHILRVPNILGECGWWIDETLVNADVVDYQERLNLIEDGGLIDRVAAKHPRILEIGGGYGALCFGLMSILEPSQYVICDLPESLLFSGLYLSCARHLPPRLCSTADDIEPRMEGEICLLPNYLAQPALENARFDLVINTLSMSEMSAHQVSAYGSMISKAIGNDGVFFEQNRDNRHLGLLDCEEHLQPFFRYLQTIRRAKNNNRGTTHIWSN